jgi:hypothetical protein
MNFGRSPDTSGHRATSECNAWRPLELAVVWRRVPVRCTASDVGTSAKGNKVVVNDRNFELNSGKDIHCVVDWRGAGFNGGER